MIVRTPIARFIVERREAVDRWRRAGYRVDKSEISRMGEPVDVRLAEMVRLGIAQNDPVLAITYHYR